MKNVIGIVGTAALSLVLASATFGTGEREDGADSLRQEFECSNRTLKGSYGIQMQGTRPVPGGTGTESVIGIVIRTYDGAGNFTQVDNIKGSTSGIVPDRPGSGTYVVNADCTGTTLFQPAPGVSIEERMVVVDIGDEVRSITISPPPNMIATEGKRIGWR